MPLLLIFLFFSIPLAEIAVFIEVGNQIGVWPTIATVILTALIGTALIRQQGLATFMEAQRKINRQEAPVAEMLHGFFLVLGGILLLVPGFVTDFFGFLLLIPALRGYVCRRLLERMQVRSRAGFSHPFPDEPEDGPHTYRTRGGHLVIDGEAEEIDPSAPNSSPKSSGSNPEEPGNPNSPWRS